MLNLVRFCKCASLRVCLCGQIWAFLHGFVLCGMKVMLHPLQTVFGKCAVLYSDLILNACSTCLCDHVNKGKTFTLRTSKHFWMWMLNNTVSYPACMWSAFPPYLYVCIHTFTWPLKSLPPQPQVPVESQMNPGCMEVVCLACNTVWDSSVSLFSIPLHELGKVKHRRFLQHYCIVCNVIQSHFIRILPLHSNAYPPFHLLYSLNPLHLLPLFSFIPHHLYSR